MLEALGVISIQHGRGAFVLNRSPVSGFLVSPWIRWLHEHAGALLELLEVREAIEAKAAELAARTATDASVARLQEVLARSEPVVRSLGDSSAAGDPDAIRPLVELDIEFHEAIADSSGNRVLADLVRRLGQALQGSREATLAIPGRARRSLQEHRAIVAAIRRRNPEAARRAMVRHVRSVAGEVRVLESGSQSAGGAARAAGRVAHSPAPSAASLQGVS